MIYILAALLPPIGLLFNGQPFAAIFNVILIVFCVVFGLIFHVLFLVPSAHAVMAVYMKRSGAIARWSRRSASTGRRRVFSARRPPVTKSCAWQPNPLIRRAAMLGTTVNPTDGLRFHGSADRYSRGRRSSQDFLRQRAAERSWQWPRPPKVPVAAATAITQSAKPTRSTTSC